MSRNPTAGAAAYQPPTAAVLTLLGAIERRTPTDPAIIAFRAALERQGREAREAGGPAALVGLINAVRAADPARAAERVALLRAAWGRTRGARGGVAVRQRRLEREAWHAPGGVPCPQM